MFFRVISKGSRLCLFTDTGHTKGLRCTRLSARCYSVSEAKNGTSQKALLSKLRKTSGFPFIKCKNALEKFDYDFNEAEAWLKEQAAKEGWSKALKLQHRPTACGLLGIVSEKQTAALLEMSCETDFVARNSQFQRLLMTMTNQFYNFCQKLDMNKVLMSSAQLREVRASEAEERLIDLVTKEISSIGENMDLTRAAFLRTTDNSVVGTYVHSAGLQTIDETGCQLGRYGAVVTFTQGAMETTSGQLDSGQIGRMLAQHIVGMNPQTIGQQQDTTEAEACDPTETPTQTASDTSQTEESTLVKQEFLLDDSRTVGQFLKEHKLTVQDFIRFECGQSAEDGQV